MTFLARLLGASRFVKPQPGQAQFLYSWAAGDDATGFTRASSADYVDRNGRVQTAAVNVPRLSLDPLGGVGLLIEPAQSFEWDQTADFTTTAGWSNAYLSVVATSVVGPRGVVVQKLVPTTASVNSHRTARNAAAASNDTPQTLIAELRDAGYRYVTITPITKDGAAYASVLDVATGAIISQSTQHTIRVQPLADSFYRFWLGANAKHGSTTMQWRVSVSDSPVVGTMMAGDGTKGVYCSLLQVATDCDYATTPLAASGSAPVRAAESWTVTAVSAPNVGRQGTIYEQYVDQLTGQLVEQVRVVTLTATYTYQAKRYYRAVKIALGNRTLSEMQGSETLPPVSTATTVVVTPTIAALSAGQTMQLAAAVKDQNVAAMPGEAVTWSTSDAGVATVTTAGAVTAVAEGTATITATSVTNGALSATCTLTVSAASAGYSYDSAPHATTGLTFTYTDFRTSYFPDTEAGRAQRETEMQFIHRHVDKSVSGGEPTGGYPPYHIHQPYILTSFQALCVHDSDFWRDGRNKTDARFEEWCTANGKNPEDGYLHWATGSAPYKAVITSIDATGKVTLTYDFVTYTAGALANGDTVVIEGCTPAGLNGTWPISALAVEGGDLDSDGNLRRAKTTFKIPHTGDVAVTKGTCQLPTRGSERTKRNRLIFDIDRYPPPRWCINHAHPTRIAFEKYRLAEMLAGRFDIGYVPDAFYVDEIVKSNIGRVAGKLCLEYGAGSSDTFYADMAAFYKALCADYPDNHWLLEIGTGSYTTDETIVLIDQGTKCAQLEQLGNTHTRFEWVPGSPKFEWIRARVRNGAYVEFCTPYFPTDTIDGGQKPGNYANDPVPAGVKAAANVRMYASLFVVALLMNDVNHPGAICCNVMNGAWAPTDPNAGLNNRWIKLFEVDLGKPVEEPARVVTGQTDTAGQGVTIAARAYERGMVAYRRIDVDYAITTVDYAATYTYTPPPSSGALGLWARVKSDGTLDVPAASFDLASDEGIILLPAAGADHTSAASVELPASATLYVGDAATKLRGIARDAFGMQDADAVITWHSSNTGVATVDTSGNVTPVAAGTANVTATISGHTATCVVTVDANTLGLAGLAARLSDYGATVVGAYHGSQVTLSGSNVTAWPDARGAGHGPTLPVTTANKPVYDAGKKSFALTQAGAEGFVYSGTGFNAITGNVAVVAVMTRPTNYASGAAQRFIFDSGNASGALLQAYNDSSVADRVKYFAQPGAMTLTNASTALPTGTERRCFAWATWHNSVNVTNSCQPRRYYAGHTARLMPAFDSVAPPTAVTDTMSLFSLGIARSGSSGAGAAVAEVAALLVLKLDQEWGYSPDVQDLLNAWAESYAGAVDVTPATVAIAAGGDIQAAVDANPVGTVFSLAPGLYTGQSITPKTGQSFVCAGDDYSAILDGTGSVQKAFKGTASAVRLKGLRITNYVPANSDGCVRGDWYQSTQWRMENCRVDLGTGAGIYVTDDMVIRGGLVKGCGQIGLLGKGNRFLMDGVEVAQNNTAGNDPTNEAGGMKFVYTRDGRVRNCDVHDNQGPGIWFDTNNYRCTIEGNTCAANTYSSIFYEVSFLGVIRRNVVTGSGIGGSIARAAIQISSSRDCEVYENVVSGNAHGIVSISSDRSTVPDVGYGTHLVTGLYVHDNDVVQASGVAAGMDDQLGDGAVYAPAANNRWNDNHYDLGPNTKAFDGPSGSSQAAWQAAGYDADSTFA